ERTTRTPGSPCRLTVNGYVIWSSTSCGERPGQSVKTMTWLSERSGMASIGVVRSAQYPQSPNSTTPAITRRRFRNDASMSQWIMPVPQTYKRLSPRCNAWKTREHLGTAHGAIIALDADTPTL